MKGQKVEERLNLSNKLIGCCLLSPTPLLPHVQPAHFKLRRRQHRRLAAVNEHSMCGMREQNHLFMCLQGLRVHRWLKSHTSSITNTGETFSSCVCTRVGVCATSNSAMSQSNSQCGYIVWIFWDKNQKEVIVIVSLTLTPPSGIVTATVFFVHLYS